MHLGKTTWDHKIIVNNIKPNTVLTGLRLFNKPINIMKTGGLKLWQHRSETFTDNSDSFTEVNPKNAEEGLKDDKKANQDEDSTTEQSSCSNGGNLSAFLELLDLVSGKAPANISYLSCYNTFLGPSEQYLGHLY